jgi:hypothetical protein
VAGASEKLRFLATLACALISLGFSDGKIGETMDLSQLKDANQLREMLSRPDLAPAVRASLERLLVARTPPDEQKRALFPVEPAAPEPLKPPKRPPSMRTKKRAEKRAADLVADLARENDEITGTGKPFRRRYRSGARFIEPPPNDVDICFRTVIWNAVEALERKSYARRGRWRRNGLAGKVGVELMRTILFRLDKSDIGRVYPGYERLAELTQYCVRAIIYAAQRLEKLGFLTIHRRCKWVDTPYGRRQVQDSNAYEYHLPKTSMGKLAMASFGLTSECSGNAGGNLPSQTTDVPSEDPLKRFWTIEPIPLGDGGFV